MTPIQKLIVYHLYNNDYFHSKFDYAKEAARDRAGYELGKRITKDQVERAIRREYEACPKLEELNLIIFWSSPPLEDFEHVYEYVRNRTKELNEWHQDRNSGNKSSFGIGVK